jgi:hypothetical protein
MSQYRSAQSSSVYDVRVGFRLVSLIFWLIALFLIWFFAPGQILAMLIAGSFVVRHSTLLMFDLSLAIKREQLNKQKSFVYNRR